MTIRNVKDAAPNKATIEILKEMLEQAKSGELRTLVATCGWDDDSVTHSWSLDSRNSRRRIIGGMALLQHEIMTNIGLEDGDSVLSYEFADEW